jgi:hypothetical protein
MMYAVLIDDGDCCICAGQIVEYHTMTSAVFLSTPDTPGSDALEEEVDDLKGMLALAKSDPVMAKELWLSHKAHSPSPSKHHSTTGAYGSMGSPPMSRSPMAMERDSLLRAQRSLSRTGADGSYSPPRGGGGDGGSPNSVKELRKTLATLDRLVQQYTDEIDGMAKQQHRWKAIVLGHADSTDIKDLKARHAIERETLEDKISQLVFLEEEHDAVLADQEAKIELLRQHIALHQIPEPDPVTQLNSAQLQQAVKDRKQRLRKAKAREVRTQDNYDNLLARAEKELKERAEELEDLQYDATQLRDAHQRMKEAGRAVPTI